MALANFLSPTTMTMGVSRLLSDDCASRIKRVWVGDNHPDDGRPCLLVQRDSDNEVLAIRYDADKFEKGILSVAEDDLAVLILFLG